VVSVVIDSQGFRQNVGVILANQRGRVFWGKRVGCDHWQFPQGGMLPDETPEQTLFRELEEEIGLTENDVTVLARTGRWLRYRIPARLVRRSKPLCIGQKQFWYLLRLEADARRIHFDHTSKPEFDGWQWISYWYPLKEVVSFKREVYRKALKELSPYLFKHSTRGRTQWPLNNILDN
jgi:putative (di)nucleoside polyphosphate hydrolase